MILRQYLHTEPMVAASYLFGRGGHAAGAVVDRVDDPGRLSTAPLIKLPPHPINRKTLHVRD